MSDSQTAIDEHLTSDGVLKNYDILPKQYNVNLGSSSKKPLSKTKDADTRAIEGDLKAAIGMSVDIGHDVSTGKGTLKIKYNNLDQLDKLINILSK